MSAMHRVRLESRTKVLILQDIKSGGSFDGQVTRHQLRVAL